MVIWPTSPLSPLWHDWGIGSDVSSIFQASRLKIGNRQILHPLTDKKPFPMYGISLYFTSQNHFQTCFPIISRFHFHHHAFFPDLSLSPWFYFEFQFPPHQRMCICDCGITSSLLLINFTLSWRVSAILCHFLFWLVLFLDSAILALKDLYGN